MLGEEILIEIDQTLDRLIRNAETLERVNVAELSEIEIEAFQKTQESLLHHLLHMDQALEAKRKQVKIPDKRSAQFKIQEKISRFEKLKTQCQRTLQESVARKNALLLKRRAKKILSINT